MTIESDKPINGLPKDAGLVKKQGISMGRPMGGKGETMDFSKLDFSKMTPEQLKDAMDAIKAQQKDAKDARTKAREAKAKADKAQEDNVRKVIVEVRDLLKKAGVVGNLRIWINDSASPTFKIGSDTEPRKITRQKDHLLSQGDYDHLLANYKDPRPEKIDGNLFLIAGKKFSAKKLVQFTILKSGTESQTAIMKACPCLSDGQVKGSVTSWRHDGEREKVQERVTSKKTK